MHRFLFMPSFILTGTYSKLYSNVMWVAMSVTVLAVRLWEFGYGMAGLFSRASHLRCLLPSQLHLHYLVN